MNETRVVLVDDHPAIRDGIAAMLKTAGTFVIVSAVGTYQEGLRAVERERPDVAVVDITLPDGNGLDLIRNVVKEFHDLRVIVLTMHARRQLADQAFEAGAHGYLLKESTGELLAEGIRRIIDGERVLDPKLAAEPLPDGCADEWHAAGASVTNLTPREIDVFRLLAVGKSGKQIGAVLGISPKTVDNHRANVMRKLCADSIAELVRIAIRTGIIEP